MLLNSFKRFTASSANNPITIVCPTGYYVVVTGFGASVSGGTALTAITVDISTLSGAFIVRKSAAPVTGAIADVQFIVDGELGGIYGRLNDNVVITTTLVGSTGSPSYITWINYFLVPSRV